MTVDVPQTGSTARLEEKTVVISADTTNVTPSSGYDGMSAVTVDASSYAQENYDDGFDDGFTDGYSSGNTDGYESGYTSGHTDGVNEEKAKLSATTFTANTAVTISDGGYSAITVNVPQTGTSIPLSSITITENTAITETEKAYSAITVNVPQTGHTDQELEEAYESGHTEGMEDQKALLVSTALTENGSYSRENGWDNVNVNVDTASTYQSGYTSGYSQGMAGQKSLLVSTAFTENGNYSRENGWSGVSVNVDTASTYNSGYTSGHTDGVNEEKAKMSAVTFTANTAVTLSDGSYSAVTVDVPQTGSSVNIEPNRPFTATTNGNYTITPSSGITTVTDHFDSDRDRYYLTAATSGYPSTGYFELFLIEDEFDSSKGRIEVYFANGSLDYDDSDWYGGDVDWDGYGNNELEVVIYDANNGFGYTILSDFNYSYDVMSAVSLNVNVDTASTYNSGYTSGYTDGQDNIIGTFSAMTATTNGQYGSSAHPLSAITVEVPQTGSSIPLSSITFTANTSVTVTDKAFTAITVNVPQSGGSGINYIEYIGINNPNRNTCYFELGNTGTGLDSKIVIEHSTLSTENAGADWENWLMFSDTERGRIFVSSTYNKIMFDGRYNASISVSSVTDETIILENTGVTIGGVSYNAAYNTSEVSDCNNMTVFCAYGNYFSTPSNQLKYGRIGTISIYDSAGTLTYKYRPCLDENNVICFYEEVNDVYVYPNNGGDTYLYSGPVINEMYESGYTDGQNSIISTFSSMTATTNGQYGSTAHPMTAITVNVPAPTYLLFAPNKSIGFSDTVMIGNGTRLKMKFKKNNSGYTGNNASIVCAQQHFQTGYIYGGIAIGKNWIGYLAPSSSLNIVTAFTFTDTPQYEWENYSITASTKGSQIILEVERNGVYTANTFNVSNSFQTSSDAHYFGINYYNATGGDTNYVRLAYDSAESYNISTIGGSDGTLRTGYVFSEIYTFI